MTNVFLKTWALFLGFAIISLAHGLQGTLLGVRAVFEGFSIISTGFIVAGYYVGYLTNTRKEVSVGEEQVSEIRDIQWLTQAECLEKIRDYHHTRYKVIHQLFDFIRGLDTDYFVT